MNTNEHFLKRVPSLEIILKRKEKKSNSVFRILKIINYDLHIHFHLGPSKSAKSILNLNPVDILF